MLTVRALTKSYGDRALWSDLDLTVAPGEMVALTGPSGSGKSTLLNCIGALDRPTRGSITWKDDEITRLGARGRRRLRKEELGYLFQSYALVESATIEQNLHYAVAGPWPWVRRRYVDELAAVGLDGREKDPVYRLSGGEQQRVALARIMAKRPGLVLADEPTGALDPANARMVVETLRSLAGQGAAVVVATHSSAVRDACDRCLDLGSASAPAVPAAPASGAVPAPAPEKES